MCILNRMGMSGGGGQNAFDSIDTTGGGVLMLLNRSAVYHYHTIKRVMR